MRVCVELSAIRHPYVGVGEFCLNLGRCLAERVPELHRLHGLEFCFIVPDGDEGIFGDKVGYVTFPGNIALLARMYLRRIDLLHLTHQYCLFTGMPHAGLRLLTVHDVNFMYEKSGWKLNRYKYKFQRQLRRADYVSFISHFTQKDTERNFTVWHPSRVIYNGVRRLDGEGSDAVDGCPSSPFLFHISSLRPKKNVHLLVEMMRYLPQETLVIAGNWQGVYGQALKQRIKETGLNNVVCLQNVSTREKAWLYSHCKAFLFPSACEGFGLPPIEAMQFGKPVFLSSLTSLPEIGGRDAFYWNSLSPVSMADVVRCRLRDGCSNKRLSERLCTRAAQFDWKTCADNYIQYYLDILSGTAHLPAN